jgi:Na+-driven multidrug efflux pump
MYLNIVRLWALRVPLAYLLSRTLGMGPPGLWVAMFVSNFITAAAGFLYLRKGGWMRKLRSADL